MRRILLTLTLCIMLCASVFSQEAKKVDEFGLESCDNTTARLDNFNYVLANNSDDKGYIVYYDGYRISKNKRYVIWQEASYRLSFFKRFLKERKADISRITFVRGGYRKDYSVEFWLVPKNKKFPDLSETVNPKNSAFRGFKVIRKGINCGEEGY